MAAPTLPSRYHLLGLLGTGGSSRVYRVHDAVRARELALKLVTEDESSFLRREFDTLRQIRHENLIQVFDWGSLPTGESYYTMELIDGGSWEDRRGYPQSEEEVRRILTGLLRGLGHIHCHGEVHGDVKPGNVLLDLGGVVKLTDVGMGGKEASGLGTVGYAAPEVWEGKAADERSDLYSVGMLGYEALTGVHPFEGKTIREVVAGQLEGWVPSPRAHGIAASAELERVLMRALERDPGLRPGSGDEFMEGLGLEDRVGQILGGRLVGRDDEIARVLTHWESEDPRDPVLIWLTGPEGIGKGAVLSEIAARIRGGGGVTCRWTRPSVEDLLSALRVSSPTDTAAPIPATTSGVAEYLCRTVAPEGTLIIVDPYGTSEEEMLQTSRTLARFVWAVAQERGTAPRALFIATPGSKRTPSARFETVIELGPLSRDDVPQFTRGMLGRCDMDASQVEVIHTATGGAPGALRAAVLALCGAGYLRRSENRWQLREGEPGQVSALLDSVNADKWDWERLDKNEKHVLSFFALAPGGAGIDEVAALDTSADPSRAVASLAAKGWLVRRDSTWRLVSGAQRGVVLRSAPPDELGRQARVLAENGKVLLGREDMADLLLQYVPSEAALEDGIWAGQEAMDRGQFSLAAARFSSCVRLAADAGDVPRGQAAATRLAKSLQQLGRDAECLGTLDDPMVWVGGVQSPATEAERLHLKGISERNMARSVESKESLTRALEISNGAGLAGKALEILADLAETDWRFGAVEERTKSIDQMRVALARANPELAGADAVAALAYGLGAGLVRAGDRKEAKQVLEKGLDLPCSDYWRVRLLNALCTAQYYLGEMEGALDSNTRALDLAARLGLDSQRPKALGNRAGILYGLGRLREATADDEMSATWARRLGDPQQFVFASNGAAMNCVVLARYEAAIEHARTACAVAAESSLDADRAKSLEVEGWAAFWIGDLDAAERLVRDGTAAVSSQEYVGTAPRLDWLAARLAAHRGDSRAALEILNRVLAASREAGDLEDSIGVEVEIARLQTGSVDGEDAEARLRRVAGEARHAGILVSECAAGVGLAEVLVERRRDDRELEALVTEILGAAERAGMLESVWRISYRLGMLALRRGDQRKGRARVAHAVRVIREIADALSPEHRRLYLSSRDVADVVAAASAKA